MAATIQITKESHLVTCSGCGKTVPKTNLCVYCGSPILYQKRTQA